MRLRLWVMSTAGCRREPSGCGTTKWSDSPRTATEQLLVSDAVDRAISEIDFSALEDRSVFLDTRFIATTLDQNYVTSTLRQHMLASGCIIKDKAEDSDFVVEVRAGSLGTNRNDVLLGVPATQSAQRRPAADRGGGDSGNRALETNQPAGGVQDGGVRLRPHDGRPVWQSGNRKVASSAKDTWLLGTGPFQRGNIYDGTSFAGEKIKSPLVRQEKGKETRNSVENSSVGTERRFDSRRENRFDDSSKVETCSTRHPCSRCRHLRRSPPRLHLPRGAASPAAQAPPAATPAACACARGGSARCCQPQVSRLRNPCCRGKSEPKVEKPPIR